MKNGYGKFEFADGDKYKGFWKNDKINGKGQYEFVNGARCEGNFFEGELNGDGSFYFLNGTPVNFEIAMLAVTKDMGNPPHRSNMLTLRVPILPSTDKTPATQQIEKMINGIVRASPEVPGSLKLGISIDMSLFFTGGASYYAMKSKEQTNFTQVIVGTDGSIPLSNENFVKFFKLFMRQGGLTPDGKLPPNMNTWPKIQRLIAKDPLSKMSEARKTGKQFDPYEQIYISNEGINNGGNEKGSREVDERGKKTVSSKGNTYNVDYSAGDVYIDCQPVNIDEEQTNVKMEGYKLQSEMDIIPTKEKITFGQMSKKRKIKMDHRFIAFKKMKKKIKIL